MNLYEVLSYVVAAEDNKIAIEIACEEAGMDLDVFIDIDYTVTKLPDAYWDKTAYLIRNGEIALDDHGEEILITYRALFNLLGKEQCVLTREF